MYAVENIHTSANSLKRMTGDSGKLVFSRVKQWHNRAVFRDISIKYVLKGTETYVDAGGRRHTVTAGNFLLGYFEQDSGECIVNSSADVDGICVYIKPEILTGIYTSLCNENKLDDEILTGSQLLFPDFFNNIYMAKHSPLETQLGKCGAWFYYPEEEVEENMLNEFIFETAEKIVFLQFGIRESMVRLNGLRPKTRKEVLKRLLIARAYMDENYLRNPSLDEIARVSGFSKYHLLRCFRLAYQQTPFGYIQEKRLDHAKAALQDNKVAIKEIALQCSFSDSAAFSKAFKRKFGVPPFAFQRHALKSC